MRTISVLVTVGLLLSAFAYFPGPARAADTYYITFVPGAKNSTYCYLSGYETDWLEHQGPSEFNYSTLRWEYSFPDVMAFAENNDFTNSEHWDGTALYESNPYFEIVDYLPHDGGTIVDVTVVSIWKPLIYFSTGTYVPFHYWYVSTDNGTSWNETDDYIGAHYHGPNDPMDYPECAFETVDYDYFDGWTPATINSTDFKVRLTAYLENGRVYFLDYFGISVLWTYPTGGGSGEGDPGVPSGDFDLEGGWWFITTKGGLLGIMGFIGVLGLVAVLPMTIWAWKNGDGDRLSLFVKMLVVSMFCLTLFLAGINQ